MSYISILLPAFYIQNETEIETISKFLSEQFETSLDSFDLIKLPLQNNYGIIFKESDVSLSSIEDLIYQRDCIKSICEKTFESLQTMSAKLSELEKAINQFTENGNNEDVKNDLMNDNMELRNLLRSQIEYSDNFKQNTERTLNTIKEEFKSIVHELETLRTKANQVKQTSKGESSYSSQNVKRYTNKINNTTSNSNSCGLGNNISGGLNMIIPKLNIDK